jgi:hypothetical protein
LAISSPFCARSIAPCPRPARSQSPERGSQADQASLGVARPAP